MQQMLKKGGGLFIAVILAATCINTPLSVRAQDNVKGAPASTEADQQKKPRPYPFNGTVHAVDKQARTVTLLGKEKNRVLHFDDQTKVLKLGKPAKLDDLAAGEEVGGQLRKTEDGRELVVSLRAGPKPENEKKPAKEPASEKASE